MQHGKTILLDADGTLVNTNSHHALAWFRAFSEHGRCFLSGSCTVIWGWGVTN